jgi:hypothetical protein
LPQAAAKKHSNPLAPPLLCSMKVAPYFSERKAEVNYLPRKSFISMLCISLPTFPFEFSVEQASNRMIDIRGLIKVLKHIQLSFIV